MVYLLHGIIGGKTIKNEIWETDTEEYHVVTDSPNTYDDYTIVKQEGGEADHTKIENINSDEEEYEYQEVNSNEKIYDDEGYEMTEEEKELLKEYQDLIKSYDNNYEEEKEEDHENQTIELKYFEQEER